MAKQVLNVDIQPIMLDMNEIIEAHITRSVTEFNIKYLTQELEEYKEKVRSIEAQLASLRSGHIASVVNLDSEDIASEDSDNIKLVIDEPLTHENNTKIVAMDVPDINTLANAKEDKNTNILSKDIETKTNNVKGGVTTSPCFSTNEPSSSSSSISDVAVPPIEPSVKNSISFDDYKATSSLSNKKVENNDSQENDGPQDDESEEVTFEEEGVFEIEVEGVTYFTTDEVNGDLYEVDENGDPGDKIGILSNGEAVFH